MRWRTIRLMWAVVAIGHLLIGTVILTQTGGSSLFGWVQLVMAMGVGWLAWRLTVWRLPVQDPQPIPTLATLMGSAAFVVSIYYGWLSAFGEALV